MTLAEIKSAVEAGRIVHVGNEAYRVVKDSIGQWLIVCSRNDYAIGLTWADGRTMNGRPSDFYIADQPTATETA